MTDNFLILNYICKNAFLVFTTISCEHTETFPNGRNGYDCTYERDQDVLSEKLSIIFMTELQPNGVGLRWYLHDGKTAAEVKL